MRHRGEYPSDTDPVLRRRRAGNAAFERHRISGRTELCSRGGHDNFELDKPEDSESFLPKTLRIWKELDESYLLQ